MDGSDIDSYDEDFDQVKPDQKAKSNTKARPVDDESDIDEYDNENFTSDNTEKKKPVPKNTGNDNFKDSLDDSEFQEDFENDSPEQKKESVGQRTPPRQ